MTSDSSPAPHGCGRRYYNNSLKMEMTVCLLYLYGPTSFHKSHRHSPTNTARTERATSRSM